MSYAMRTPFRFINEFERSLKQALLYHNGLLRQKCHQRDYHQVNTFVFSLLYETILFTSGNRCPHSVADKGFDTSADTSLTFILRVVVLIVKP